MKYALLFFFLSMCMTLGWTQSKDSVENILIRAEKKKTKVDTGERGELQVNISPKDLQKFKNRGWIQYSDLGAKGDGKTDDIDHIAATHAVANQYGLPVKADDGAMYYLSGKERTAVIRTNTDFGSATFIIDDTQVQNRNAAVFIVSSELKPFKLEKISSLKRNQQKILAVVMQTLT